MRISVVFAVAVAALSACKGKPTNNNTPGPVGSGGSNGSASMGKLVPNKGSDVAPDIVLPHADGTPPIKTTASVTKDKLTELSQMQFAGFLRDVRKAETYLEVRHKTDSRPRLMTTVVVEACANLAGGCTPMELDKWKAKSDELKVYLAPELKTLPDTQFDIGETDLHGAKAIYTLQLAQALDKGSDGNTHGAYSYAYALYFNDGMNQIRVISEFKDDPMMTKEDMVKSVPRADLEKVSKAFADIYTHSWQ